MLHPIRKVAGAMGSLLLLAGLNPPAAFADGVVRLEIRPSPTTPDVTVELVEVKKKPDGTTEDVPVKDRDGTPIKERPDKLRNLVKPPSDENPEGGRVGENAEDRRKERISLTLPAGTYKFRIVDVKSGATKETGKFVVPEGAGSDQKNADGVRVKAVKLTMSGREGDLYIPEGYRVSQADSSVLEPGSEYAAAPGLLPVPAFAGFEVAFTPGGTFGHIGTRQNTSFSDKASGKAIQYDAANLHGDVRYYLGDLGGVGGVHPSLLVGLKGAGTLGGAETGLREDNHPPGGEADSFVRYEIGGSLTPYLGLVVADFDCSRINLLVGPRITFAKISGSTDESGGGGEQEEFNRNVVQVGPAVGVELDIPITQASFGGVEGGLRVAGWGEYLPGVDVSGESSTFAFDYRFATKDAFLFTVRAGFFVRFAGL
jgi:hypothetical protein